MRMKTFDRKSLDLNLVEAGLKAANTTFITEIAMLQRQIDPLISAMPKLFEILASNQGRLIISGIGKSGHIGKKIAATLSSTGTPSFFIHSTEALHGDAGMVMQGDVVILISNSGNTAEVVRFAEVLKHLRIPIISITSSAESKLAKSSDVVIKLAMAKEGDPLNVAPMASSTATLVIGDAIASALMVLRSFTKDEFAVFHVSGSLGAALGADDIVKGK
mgnify:CR=1 FL=1